MICPFLPAPMYLVLADGVPGLLYYSHIPSIVISLLIGAFVFFKNPRSLLNGLLFALAIFFSLWTFLDLIVWTNIHSDTITFVWSFFGLLCGLISITSVYFIYVFLKKKDVGFGHKLSFFILLAPILFLTPTSYNIRGFSLDLCGSSGYEGIPFVSYYSLLGGLAFLWIAYLLVHSYIRAERTFRKQIIYMGLGMEFFLLAFLTTGFVASYLNDQGILADYSLEHYGLFGMTFFMAVLAFLIVRFKAFNVGMLAAQALVIALIILVGSQFTYVRTTTNLVLTAITLVLTGVLGSILIRSVKREVQQRERLQRLAKELEKANAQQVTLIHFITHQIKGFVAKSRNIFSMALDGDFGPVPEGLKPMLEEGLRSDTQGVATIQEILNASNIKSGKTTYTMTPFDLKALIDEIAGNLKQNAETKGLKLELHTEPVTFTGDRAQLTNAFKNLIDNSIKYTQAGSVTVSLTKGAQKVKFEIHDTGVGITPEDMKNLFTEGGHGAESTKVNVESTGFGLYIVKNIVEAHKGKVWAESDGAGKGSRFIVELPAA